jgi:carbonic anhydrase
MEADQHGCAVSRRAVLASALAIAGAGSWRRGAAQAAAGAALSQEQRDQMTPDAVIEMLKAGNERFRTRTMQPHDYLAQKQQTAAGQ